MLHETPAQPETPRTDPVLRGLTLIAEEITATETELREHKNRRYSEIMRARSKGIPYQAIGDALGVTESRVRAMAARGETETAA